MGGGEKECPVCLIVVYFAFAFNFFFSLIVFGCFVLHVTATILLSEWRTKFKRDANNLENQTKTIVSLKTINSVIKLGIWLSSFFKDFSASFN